MNKQDSAVDEFFGNLPSEDKKGQDIFDDKKELPKEEAPVKETDPEEVPDDIKNRQHRRLEVKLQKERESNIALAERVKILSEQDKFAKDVEIDPRIAKMFDTTEVGKENALRLSEVLHDMSSKAKEQALQEVEQRKQAERQEEKQYNDLIDTQLESIEDEFNVDVTSNAPAARKTRNEFLKMVQDLSPKDESGELTGYADFRTTFQLYKERNVEKVDNSRQKEIASRSMQKSSTSDSGESKTTPGFRGWQRDYGLE